jgi:hypothetical protein
MSRASKQQGFHEDFGREQLPEPGSTRSFAITMAIVLGLAGLFLLAKTQVTAFILLFIAAVLLALELLWSRALEPLNWLWFKLGMLMARVVSPLVMAVIFFGVVTPIGLVRRLGGADSLRLKRDPAVDSWWQEREPPGPDPKQLPRQF